MFPREMERLCANTVKDRRKTLGFPRMPDPHNERADDGSVLNSAMAAVMLIVAGLGLMVWDNSRDPAAPVPIIYSL